MYDYDKYLLTNEDELEKNDELLKTWKELPLKKMENITKFIKEKEAQNDEIDLEIKRLKEKKASNERKIENTKNFIISLLGDNKINIGVYTLSTFDSHSVEVLDELKVPEEFKDEKITYTISKTRIREFLEKELINEETGEILPVECDWAKLKTKKNLRIK